MQVLLLDGKGWERGRGHHTGQQVEGGAYREDEKWDGGWRAERRDWGTLEELRGEVGGWRRELEYVDGSTEENREWRKDSLGG